MQASKLPRRGIFFGYNVWGFKDESWRKLIMPSGLGTDKDTKGNILDGFHRKRQIGRILFHRIVYKHNLEIFAFLLLFLFLELLFFIGF